jgi:peptidoglycan hydrolase-like amidase
MEKKNKKTTIALGFLFAFLLFLGLKSEAYANYSYERISFYTQSNSSSYVAEGTAFYAFKSQQDQTIPVYRFFNPIIGDHFFTISETEKNELINSPSSGYNFEGIAFYTYDSSFSERKPVYRFFNHTIGDHFYTASEGEKDALINNPLWGYSFEGTAFYVAKSQEEGSSATYRFFNGQTGDHFYTISETEKNSLSQVPVFRFFNPSTGDHFYTSSKLEKSLLQNVIVHGYKYEGIAFYAFFSQITDTSPVFRFFNPSTGDHFYTISSSEKDSLINDVNSGYKYEGIAFYAYTSKVSGSSPVYRFYNSVNGDHFYTISESEKIALETSGMGPEISVGLWNYGSRSALQDSPFKISANKAYNIKDSNGNVVGKVSGTTNTRVTYDSDSYLKAYDSIASTRSKKVFYFDAADGNNSDLIFDVNRPDSSYDKYRGKIKIQYTDSSNLWVINTLPMEQYVWGMGETSGTGDLDHTKVMTTIFRTYGYWYVKYATKYNAYGFKIRSDSGSQIYRGYTWESTYPNIRKAAEGTKGVVATYDGDVALTPYSSWSAGKTRSFEEAWGSKEYPWCKSVDDPYGDYNSDHFDNSTTKTQSELIAAGNHMVGLVAHGSLYLAGEKDWSYSKIMKYYYTGIGLNASY